MKGIIVYKGKYGATRQYADWLAEELQLPVFRADTLSSRQLKEYDVILIGTSVYTGKLKIAAWLKENQSLLEHKKIFLFIVSATKPTEKEKLDAYTTSGIPGDIREKSQIYYLPGRLIFEKLTWTDRFLLKMVALLSKNSNGKRNTPVDFDNVKKDHLKDMINDIKETVAPEKKAIPV